MRDTALLSCKKPVKKQYFSILVKKTDIFALAWLSKLFEIDICGEVLKIFKK